MAITTATALAIATAAGTAGKSFSDSDKQKKLQKQAVADATSAMVSAKKLLEVNTFDKLSIQKEPYELEREANIAAGAQATEAGVESERGGAATAGRVLGQQNIAQADTRTAMGKDLQDLALRKATEQSRLRDVNVQLYLSEVEGQQQMAADAAAAQAAATAQGFESITSGVQTGIENASLYGKGGEQKRADKRAAKTAKQNLLKQNTTSALSQQQKDAFSAKNQYGETPFKTKLNPFDV